MKAPKAKKKKRRGKWVELNEVYECNASEHDIRYKPLDACPGPSPPPLFFFLLCLQFFGEGGAVTPRNIVFFFEGEEGKEEKS